MRSEHIERYLPFYRSILLPLSSCYNHPMNPNGQNEDWQAPQQVDPASFVPDAQAEDSIDESQQPIDSVPQSIEQNDSAASDAKLDYMTPVHWQAVEYIQREKSAIWYIVLAIVTVGLMLVAILWMQSWSFAILVPVMSAALVIYARRPPHEVSYTLSRQGLHIGDVLYPYSDYKSFTLISGDDQHQIMLVPIKRFKPGISVYFPEEVGERIVDMLAARLPMREQHLDAVDRLIRKLRI